MSDELLQKWVEEIRLQSRFASYAWQEMRSSLVGMNNEKSLFYVHAFLNHTAELNQMLWPESKNERGPKLRKALELDEGTLLLKNNLQRIITHFGERLDLWMDTVENAHFLNINVMPKGTMAGAREDVFVRSLDPETYQLEILDQSFDLRELYNAIRQLDKKAANWCRKH